MIDNGAMPPASCDEDWLDNDIREMQLGYGEKSGLQIYRNYTRSFETHNIKRFRDALDHEPIDLEDFKRLVQLLIYEDVRFTPVIVCGFADDLLKSVFMDVLPKDVPGGRTSMLSGYGPLSTLSERIRMAYAFDVLSQDLMTQIDAVRKMRNRISHDWDIGSADYLIDAMTSSDLYPIEQHISEQRPDIASADLSVDRSASLRVRLIWLMGRLTYEGSAFNKAKRARLNPTAALYGKTSTKWLAEIAGICADATRAFTSKA